MRVSREELEHTRVLIEHIIVCARANEIAARVTHQYDMLVLREACAIYEDPTQLRRLRDEGCQCCGVQLSYERDVTEIVIYMKKMPAVYDTARALIETCRTQRCNCGRESEFFHTRDVREAMAARDRSDALLRRKYMARAVWKYELGLLACMTSLEHMLVDPACTKYMCLSPASVRVRTRTYAMVARHIAALCRGCGSSSSRRVCCKCKRAFFCSSACEIRDACNKATCHEKECDLLA